MLKCHCGGWEIMSCKDGLYSRNWFLVSVAIILVFPRRTFSPVPWACTRHPPMYPSGMLLPVPETAPTDPWFLVACLPVTVSPNFHREKS